MQKYLFIDRDGTLVLETEDEKVDSFSKMTFYPFVFRYLGQIVREMDYRLVMVSNQDGVGTDFFPAEKFWPVHEKIVQTFAGEGIHFDEILIDTSFEHENAPTRKPGTAMLTHYLDGRCDMASSFVIGDRLTDLQLAKNLGCRGILIGGKTHPEAALCTENWADIYFFLKKLNPH